MELQQELQQVLYKTLLFVTFTYSLMISPQMATVMQIVATDYRSLLILLD